MDGKFSMKGEYRIIRFRKLPKSINAKNVGKLYRSGELNDYVLSVSPYVDNLIMLDTDVGLNLVMRQMSGDYTYPLEIDSAGIGIGSTAPSSSDTGLEFPIVTGIVKSTGVLTDVNTLFTEWFFTNDDLPDGTYTEFALFMGTRIFCRSIISPEHTKGAQEDTLFEYTHTVSNS